MFVAISLAPVTSKCRGTSIVHGYSKISHILKVGISIKGVQVDQNSIKQILVVKLSCEGEWLIQLTTLTVVCYGV